MTEVINMKADDPRVGRYGENAILWPKVDCDGNPFNKKSASTRSLKDTSGQNCFVVIPPNRDHDDLVFEIIVSAPVEAEPAAEPVPEREDTAKRKK